MVLEKGFAWNGKTYGSLSQIAKAMTGTSWNGHRFFGLRPGGPCVKRRAGRRLMRAASAPPVSLPSESNDAVRMARPVPEPERAEAPVVTSAGLRGDPTPVAS
jgi:hypothetical protein